MVRNNFPKWRHVFNVPANGKIGQIGTLETCRHSLMKQTLIQNQILICYLRGGGIGKYERPHNRKPRRFIVDTLAPVEYYPGMKVNHLASGGLTPPLAKNRDKLN